MPPEVNAFWTHESFHSYADYALSSQFREGLDHLIDDGRQRRCAIMCSEAVWWRCHRRIVADYLLARGETVIHIMAPGRVEPATLTPGAVVSTDCTIGDFSYVDTYVILGHDVQVGEHCMIGAMSFLAGSVRVESGVAIHPRATIAKGVTLGQGSTVGIGSVVVKDVPPQVTVFGNPARTIYA